MDREGTADKDMAIQRMGYRDDRNINTRIAAYNSIIALIWYDIR